jgi:Gram-negative bacterial TonB protein C-terminal
MEVNLNLTVTNDEVLEAALNGLGQEVSDGLVAESRHSIWLRADTKRLASNRARVELRAALLPVVFPCANDNARSRPEARLRDRSARYPGGEKMLKDLLTINLRNEDDPLIRHIEGRVEVEFWVLEDGTVYQPRLTRLLYPACDKRALEIFSTMRKWEPAIRSGKPVRLKYARDVVFVREGVRRSASAK